MCKTRIKVIDEYTVGEELEVAVNMFIRDPKNKVIKVNSVKFETYYDEDDDPCLFAVINYELGE